MARLNRLKKEIKMLRDSPPSEISCWPEDENFNKLQAIIFGDEETVYRGGAFKLEIEIPERYPFEPPKIRFVTPIYHPNIDSMGRICLSALKMPPSGSWRPALNVASLLISIRLLMAAPNGDDPLMADIGEEFKLNREAFEATARKWTRTHALPRSQSPKKETEEPLIKKQKKEQTN